MDYQIQNLFSILIPYENKMFQKNNNEEFEFNHQNHQKGGSQLENKDDTSSALSTLDEKDEKGSVVWKHFDRFVDNKGTSWAKCRYCRNEIIKNFLQSANNVKIKFSNELFRAKLVEWIATDDQPFTVVKLPEFRYVIQICNAEAQISMADTIKSNILKLYKSYHINIQNILQNTPGKISFALDIWTSPNVIGFLGITGSHLGENMANMFVTCLKEKKILTKILAIAADNNVANNNTFLKSLEQTCVENHIAFHHKENHVRCIAHIMNLTVQEILKHIRVGEAQDENIILEELLEKNNKTNDIIPKLKFGLHHSTRWNSTYLMIECALQLQKITS
ncbi:zinc finger BED domain-containing protein RICESLEEPER 2-like [Rhizophagus irregularis DAOM 181602=DAOM 197198]|nr:zinc finger BED domain-containing protein RICESLEEPER 2-like [Rhizophagus irregularis DAOM 181602=DAOM 197198]